MSLRPYQSYKPTKLAWSESVPAHWELKKIGYLVEFAQGKAHEPFIDEAGLHICVNSRFVSTSGLKVKFCTDNLTPASKGDILVVMSDLPNGRALARAFHVEDEKSYAVNQRVCRITAKKADSRFLYYVLNRNPGLLKKDDGANQTHLSSSDFQKLVLFLPSAFEQTQIARFLDHETAKIDALIAEQKRLIKLLQEKRQAVISHAVTKGLDPNVPMKDSGVEWLGDVPAHWEIRKVSYDFIAVKGPRGAILTKEYCASNQGPYPVYSGQTENSGVLGSINDFDFSLGSNGGLLTTTVGAKAMSLNFVTNNISLSQNCMLIRPLSRQIFIKFYLYHFQPLFRLERGMIPDHMQPSFRMEDLYRFFVARPPVEEQKVIAHYLDEFATKVDMLINEAGNSINLMQERRSALISAAVTGKIDVRDWQPPADESAFDEGVRKAGLEASA